MAGSVGAQSVLDRAPNVAGGWVGGPRSLHFSFLHRFNHSGAPQRQVTNRPTFLVAYRMQAPLLLGAQYATRSDIVDRYPNEWEVFARYGALQEDAGAFADATAQLGYNVAARSVDGALTVARRFGPVRAIGAARGFGSGYGAGEARFAVAAGASLRLTQSIALAADVATLLDRADTEELAWGAAVQIALPLTPHSLSLQATNTNTSTLQGASRGAEEVRWGFEFTVPIALARYRARRVEPVAALPPPSPDADSMRAALADSITHVVWSDVQGRLRADSAAAARALAAQQAYADSVRRAQAREDSVRAVARADSLRRAREEEVRRAQLPPFRAGMRNLAYTPVRIEVMAGTTVIWRNNDQVEHSVTAVDRSFDSGLIRPGGTWQRRFDRPGTYEVYCTPHPFMKATIVVRAR